MMSVFIYSSSNLSLYAITSIHAPCSQNEAGTGWSLGVRQNLLLAPHCLRHDLRLVPCCRYRFRERFGRSLCHLGNYQVLTLPDYSPETYIEAIGICEQAGAEVIVIDSISHCWDYLLDFHANLQGNSFANWAKVTPRQNAFIQRILNSSCHIICTMRSKQDYVLSDKNGKMVPEKVGLKAVQRDNVDYEFTAVLDIAMNHKATTSKDRTGLFTGRPEFTITPAVGQAILKWCNMTQTAQPNPSTQNLHSHASSLSA